MNTKITKKISTFVLVFLALIIFGATIIKAAPGDLDPTFGNGGKVITDFGSGESANAIVLQPDGKLIVAGGTNALTGDFLIVRYNGNGSLDTSFGNGGRVSTDFSSGDGAFAVVLQPDGKIVAAGVSNFTGSIYNLAVALARYNADGSLDSTFGNGGKVTVPGGVTALALVLQADGKLVTAGFAIGVGDTNFALIRYNTNGSLDSTFGNNGRVTTDFNGGHDLASALVVQADGKLVAAGCSRSYDAEDSSCLFSLARYNADGTLDATFGSGGKVTTGFGQPGYYFTGLDGLALQADGKIVAAGTVQLSNFNRDFALVRYNTNGTLDTTFGAGGKITTDFGNSDEARDVVIQPDGKIVAAGNTVPGFALARYLGDSVAARRTPFDFDGDGKADISVFRPSDGFWYLNQSTNGLTGIQFGFGTDKIVPADYDGDGKTDIAVYRDGTWFVQRSTTGFLGLAFGAATDIPVPADYDGDSRAEIAVFRPSDGTWYIYNLTTNQFTGFPFGQAGDVPVASDYDGDGKADVAVFRNGTWYIQRSRDGFTGVAFGQSGDKPVPADYDGDGKTDIAVFRPSNGVWYLLQSRDGFTGIAFGFGTDLPTPADYDGDGKTDIAVFRNGTWYLQSSRDGFTGIGFGFATDKPVPNAFIP